jgi:hypothetical protein
MEEAPGNEPVEQFGEVGGMLAADFLESAIGDAAFDICRNKGLEFELVESIELVAKTRPEALE